MKMDKWFGLGLVLVSMGASVLIVLGFVVYDIALPWSVVVWPSVGVVVGLLIFVSDVVENHLQLSDEIEDLLTLVSDDFQDFLQGRFTLPMMYLTFTVAAMTAQVYLIFFYQKWLATWGVFNVLLTALGVVLVTLWLLLRSSWFQYRPRRTGWYLYALPAIGWIICIALGVYWAEPSEFGGLSPLERTQLAQSDQYWSSTRGSTNFFSNFTSSPTSDIEFDCDDEGCLLAVIVIVIALCILGSIIIPHFWALATSLLLGIMMIITIRELLYKEGHPLPYRRGY